MQLQDCSVPAAWTLADDVREHWKLHL